MVSREILNSHPISVLKKEISKTNIKGYSKMKKPEIVELMMKTPDRFSHIKMNEKARKKAEPKKKVVKEDSSRLEELLKDDKPKKAEPKQKASGKEFKKLYEMLKERGGIKKHDVILKRLQRKAFKDSGMSNTIAFGLERLDLAIPAIEKQKGGSEAFKLMNEYITEELKKPIKTRKKAEPKRKWVVEFRNKDKNFKPDKKTFTSEKKAREWASKNIENLDKDNIYPE